VKAVLMSIQPKWCELIANGKKTIEVRKTRPKLETPFKVYIYCTNNGGSLHTGYGGLYYHKSNIAKNDSSCINGKVIGEFVCDETCDWYHHHITTLYGSKDGYFIFEDDLNASCLTYEDIVNYGTGKTVYGWHISDLVIYDKPKELSEFEKPWYDINDNWHDIRPCECGKRCEHEYFDYLENAPACGIDYSGDNCPYTKITRPPQSWCYVERSDNNGE
jgi:predicted transcriptional regulator